MNDTGQMPETELIFRRLSEPFPVGPTEYGSVLWLVVTGLILAVGFVFVVWMYLRDSKTAKLWAIPLAILRMAVYVLLAIAFLLPAIQRWETTEKHSRVVVVLDISPSVSQTTDELGSAAGVKPKTRMDQVLSFLTDEQVGFLSKLLERNPVTVYRFGTRLDEEPQVFEAGQPTGWTKTEWDAWVRYDFKPWVLRGLAPATREKLTATAVWKGNEPGNADWAMAWAKLPETETIPADLSPEERQTVLDHRSKLEKRVDVARAIVLGTNVPDSLTAIVNREAANMVQAMVVFTDGRSNLGSESAYRTLKDRASREKIPLFTVAVGEPRENIAITITDVQAPDRAPPDEQFKVQVEADGVGLGDAEVEVKLGLFMPGRDPKKDAPDHELVQKLTFRGDTSPPHGLAEFVIDPESKDLPEALTEPSKKVGRTRQLKEGSWAVVAKIARDKREVFQDAQHVSPVRPVQVLDRPLRVLLFASGPTREYQTLRTLLVRETSQNRAELSICLQTEGGREGTGVQDVPPERMLTKFPTRLDTTNKATDKPEDKYYNLNEYDLVIAFDPDWSELSADQVKNLQTWVDNLGGGFVYVAGPLCTFQLARADETGRLKPLLDVMPVIPDDSILIKTRPVPRTERRLLLKPNPEFDVLRLDDSGPEDPVAGWEPFFTGREKFAPDEDPRKNLAPERGFFSYYPVKATKPGASVLAEFLDVKDDGSADPKPWLVTTQPARGRTVFLASGEIWRLRAFNLDFYDRFWVKLSRYAASNRDVRASRGRVLMNKEFVSGSQIRVQARLLAPNGSPYDPNTLTPKFRIQEWNANADQLKKMHGPFEMKPRKGGGEFDGYYSGQVLAEPSRFPTDDTRYRVLIDVPDSPGDTIQGEFLLKKSDPELDNTRPDFEMLEEAASTLEEVRGRIKDAAVLEKLKGPERDPSRVKLAYKLSETDKLALIPACIEDTSQTFRNRGAVEDLWDKGPTFELAGRKIEIGWLLLAAIACLSLEWLTRKLLRLA